jgi:Tol biopolymer transport system component
LRDSVRVKKRLSRSEGRFGRGISLFTLVAGLALSALGSPSQLVSVPDPSQLPPAGGSGDSYAPICSPDGRYVLFASTANNLVLTSNNAPISLNVPPSLNVFLRDRTTQTTTLVSVNRGGFAGGNGDSWPCDVSADGRYALFESSASDLVPGDTNNATDVFVRDLANGATLLVSVSTEHGVGNGTSRSAVMTPDGRYVAFVSAASNLVPGDTNGIADVFVRDLQAGTTRLISQGAMSSDPTSILVGSDSPEITADGRYVAFFSTATNLVPGVTNVGDVYVHDVAGGTTVWASSYGRTALQSLNRASNAICYNLALSADGQFAAYEASPSRGLASSTNGVILRYNTTSGVTDVVHTNGAAVMAPYEEIRTLSMTPDGRFIAFVANTNNAVVLTSCVYVWDGQANSLALASASLSNAVPAGSTCDWPVLDASGRFVAFVSSATNLVTNTLSGSYHLYKRDMVTGTMALIDADTNGVGCGISPACAPRVSSEGRFITFECLDSSLTPDDRNHAYDVFLRDTAAAATELVSVHHPGLESLTPNGSGLYSKFSLSMNGRFIAFASDADNLVAGDTNGCPDVFMRDTLNGTNLLISMATNSSAEGDFSSIEPVISGDGRYVAFTSYADNLVPGATNGANNVFRRDLQTATTILVSSKAGGGGAANGNCSLPLISADGSCVLFRSVASNLTTGAFGGTNNLFLRNVPSAVTYTLTTTGSGPAAMTPDGRYVAYGGLSNGVYVWDSQAAKKTNTIATAGAASGIGISPDGKRMVYSLAGQLHVVERSANTNGLLGPVASIANVGLRFSGDGRYLTYTAPLDGTNQVYLTDFEAGTTLLVSHNDSSGTAAQGAADSPDISVDGRFVAYRSDADDIVPGDTNGLPDVFLYDRLNNTTTLLSVSRFGNWTADSRSLTPCFSGDGQTVCFQTWAADLAAQDFNNGIKILAYNLYASSEIPLFAASIIRGVGAGQGAWITWPIVPGKTYTVQFKNTLSDSHWRELNGNVSLVGNQGFVNDIASGSGPRFYRVTAD